MGSYRSDVARMAEDIGYHVDYTNSGHFKFTHPEVPVPIFASSTPTNQFRTMRNVKASLLRALRHARANAKAARIAAATTPKPERTSR